jgi:hypothetical protein
VSGVKIDMSSYKEMREACNKWESDHPATGGCSPLEGFLYGLITEREFWKIINDGEGDA